MHIRPATRMATNSALGLRLLDRGRSMLNERRIPEALLMLERAAIVPEAPPEAFGLLAEALLEADRADEALLAADRAIAKGEADGTLRLLRARIRRGMGDMSGGMDDAAASVMAMPGNPEAMTLLATCLSEAARHDEALFFFHQVFAASPGDALPAAMLAMAFMRANRHEAAEELYALAETLSGKPRGLVILRAQNAILAGDARRAADMLEAALVGSPPQSGVWSMLGQAYHRLGLTDRAGEAYAEASALEPDNAYLRHLAMAVGASPAVDDRASEQYVTEVFDGFATRFEESLFSLGYRIPGVMLRMIEAQDPDIARGRARLGDVLDLGCGTGLMGAVLHDLLGGRLVGVDLSPRMLDVARAKQVYTELRCADVLSALRKDDAGYAVILMADLLCYFGALEEIFAAARLRLAPGGSLLFSVEAGMPGTNWVLTRNARYQQSEAYVRSALSRAGFAVPDFRIEVLRFENGEPVEGYVVLTARGH